MTRALATAPRGRALLGPVLAGVAALLALLAAAAPAAAHATLVGTDPAEGAVLAATPDVVTFTFDEPVRLPADAVQVFDATGAPVESDAATSDADVVVDLPETLAEGTYVVSWRVVSTDGHPISGALSFSVGAPSPEVAAIPGQQGSAAVGALQAALHGLLYLALFLSAGLALFTTFLLPREVDHGTLRRRLRRAVLVAAVVAGVAAVLLVPVGTLHQQGAGLAGLLDATTWTSRLTSADSVLAQLVVLGLAVVVAGADQSAHRARWAVAAGALLALGALALVGHTRGYGPLALVVPADVLHVTTGAIWFGGLVGLAVTLPALSGDAPAAARTLARFSTLAATMLVLLTLAGSVLAWRILGSWSGFVETAFGLVLLTKIGLVALTAAAAGWNRYRLLPRVDRDGPHLLTRTVRAEAGLLVVVLALTGVLVTRSPEESAQPQAAAAAQRSTVTATAGDVRVVAQVQPGRVGRNTVVVQLQDAEGSPLEPYAAPAVSLSLDPAASDSAGVDLGRLPLVNVGSGTYLAEAVVPTAGTWELQVSVRTSEFDNPVVVLEVPIEQ